MYTSRNSFWNKISLNFRCRAVKVFAVLLSIWPFFLNAQKINYFLIAKVKSPVLLLTYDRSAISVQNKLVFNHALGFGFNYQLNQSTLFNAALDIGFERLRLSSYRSSSPNNFRTQLSFFSIGLDAKYGFILNPKTRIYIGLASNLLLPRYIKISGKGSADITTSSSSLDFTPSLNVRIDPRIHLSCELKLFKSKNVRLWIGSEYAPLKNRLSYRYIDNAVSSSQLYIINYRLIQPFVCVTYYF